MTSPTLDRNADPDAGAEALLVEGFFAAGCLVDAFFAAGFLFEEFLAAGCLLAGFLAVFAAGFFADGLDFAGELARRRLDEEPEDEGAMSREYLRDPYRLGALNQKNAQETQRRDS